MIAAHPLRYLLIILAFACSVVGAEEPPGNKSYPFQEMGKLEGLEPEVVFTGDALVFRTTTRVLVTHLDTASPLYDATKHTGLMDVAGVIDGPTTVLAVEAGKNLRVPLGHAVMIQGEDPDRRLAVIFLVGRLKQARLFLHDYDRQDPTIEHGGRHLRWATDPIELEDHAAAMDMAFEKKIQIE